MDVQPGRRFDVSAPYLKITIFAFVTDFVRVVVVFSKIVTTIWTEIHRLFCQSGFIFVESI